MEKNMSSSKNRKKKNYIRIRHLKENSYCEVCKKSGKDITLEFHHILPKKKTVVNAAKTSKKQMKEEIRKCILLCKSHHKHIHRIPLKGPGELDRIQNLQNNPTILNI